MGAQQTPSTVGVALSGGGYRAALFTLGSPLYLSVAVDGRSLTAITSVSAESFTEGFIGQTTDLRSIRLTRRGILGLLLTALLGG